MEIIARNNPHIPGIIISDNFLAVNTGATIPPANQVTPKFARNSESTRFLSMDNLIATLQ